MPICEVHGCNNRTWCKSVQQVKLEKTQHITFHLFPKDPTKRKLWLDIVGLDKHEVHFRSVLCSMHFKSDDFDKSSKNYVKLKATAVPLRPMKSEVSSDNNESGHGSQHQIPQIPRVIDNRRVCRVEETATVSTSNMCQTSSDEDLTSSYLYKLLTVPETRKRHNVSGPSDEGISPTKKPQNLSVENIILGMTTGQNVAECFAVPQVPKVAVDKTTQVSPARTLQSPKKQYLRTIIRKMKKTRQREIRQLNEKRSRGVKRIAILGEVFKSLREKNFISSEHIDVLNSIGPLGVEFLKRVINKNTGQLTPTPHPNELRSFALTLHYFSPRAYAHVREKFNSRLPHPKSLTRWYQSVNGEPGFSTVALGYIKSRANSAPHALIGALILDEISLRQHVEYDGNCFRGFVDAGSDIAVDNVTLAKTALVFLVVGVNQSWKIPIGYFLVDSLNGEQRCNIVRQSLILLHDNGLRVISVTCDGAASNFAMAKELQCNLSNPAALKTSFGHPSTNEDVHVFFDPCHMLKLVQNTLGDSKYLVNAKGQRIEWSYIEELEMAQETGFILKDKALGAPFYTDNENMKISLPAEMFSSSIASAIDLCRNRLVLSQFENSEATEEFVRLFDDLFDVFTSRNLRQAKLKHPINPNNRDEVFKKLSEAKDYILGLVGPRGKPVVSSERKMGFLGFLASIESLRSIHSDVFGEEKIVECLPMYNLSQSPAQLIFGCIRAIESQNESPNVRQFRSAFIRILARAESKGAGTGTCMSLEDIPIEFVSSYTNDPELIIIHSTLSYKYEDKKSERLENAGKVFHEEAHALSILKSLGISEHSDIAISYIASFIVRRLTNTLDCGKCATALNLDRDSRLSHCYLIPARDEGKLYYPTNSVIEIFKTARRVIRYIVANSGELSANKKFSERHVCTLILSEINEKKVFPDLRFHSNDQCGLDNHRIQLTRCVILEYVKNVAFNAGKESINYSSRSERRYLSKMILFKGV